MAGGALDPVRKVRRNPGVRFSIELSMVVGPLDGQAPRSARKCCRLAGHAVTMPEINEALVAIISLPLHADGNRTSYPQAAALSAEVE